MTTPLNHGLIKAILIQIGNQICNQVHFSLKTQAVEQLNTLRKEKEEDAIFHVDRETEGIILSTLKFHARDLGGIVLISEGKKERIVLPEGMAESKATLQIIIHPINGRKEILYDKRSAFFLAGVALNNGERVSLVDLEVAVMIELPTTRSILSDVFSAAKGQGAEGLTRNIKSGETNPRYLAPSKSKTIQGGFAQIARFSPPGKGILASIEEDLIRELFPKASFNERQNVIMEDQYISTGGQIHEMLLGHDRFIADIRSGLNKRLKIDQKEEGWTCHAYDLCCALIATEGGIILTDRQGNPIDTPLDIKTNVDWIAYANEAIREEVEPTLQKIMKKYQVW